MRVRAGKLWVACAVFVLGGLLSARGDDTKPLNPDKVSIQEMVHDTQHMGDDPGTMKFVWWIPTEYWRVSMSKAPNVTPQQIDKVADSMSKYTVLAVTSGDMTNPAHVVYESESTLRDKLKIKDQAGHEYTPIAAEDVDTETQSVLAAIKPVLGNMIGAMGKHMYFVLFPANDADNHPIADPQKEGKFTVEVGDAKFDYHLPLPSLVEKKECPTCHEKLPGTYKFCPYDGAKLDGNNTGGM